MRDQRHARSHGGVSAVCAGNYYGVESQGHCKGAHCAYYEGVKGVGQGKQVKEPDEDKGKNNKSNYRYSPHAHVGENLFEADAGNGQRIVYDYPGTIGLTYNFIGNDPSGVISNVKIRQAISYAIDREEMIEGVYGRYKPAYSYVSPAISFDGSSFRSQSTEVIKEEFEQYNNDSAALQALFQEGLDELGVTTPISDITITYLCYGNTTEQQAEMEYLQQTIQQKIGCKVELNAVGDYSLFKAERDAGNYDMMYSGWYADYNDPLDFLYTYYTDAYGDSYGCYSNEKYDALVDSLTGENDTATRFEIYQELEEILLLEDCAFVPLYHATKEVFLQNWVKDYRTSSFGASAEFYITYIEGRA